MVRVVRTKVTVEGRVHEETVIIEGEEPPPWEDSAALRTVGQAIPRVDGRERVTGAARYTYDIQLPGMIYGAILRSPHAHARIKRLDIAAAAALPGVRAVLCAENAPGINWYGKVSRLFDTTLRFVGDEVAAVAADSLEIALAALALITVEYEVLPAVLDPEAAMQPGARASTPTATCCATTTPRRTPTRRATRTTCWATTIAAAMWSAASTTPTWWSRAPGARRPRCTTVWKRTAASPPGKATT